MDEIEYDILSGNFECIFWARLSVAQKYRKEFNDIGPFFTKITSPQHERLSPQTKVRNACTVPLRGPVSLASRSLVAARTKCTLIDSGWLWRHAR